MKQQTSDILKKISYIEADIEIQKQILFGTPTAKREDLEKQVAVIAEKKAMVQSLRESIRETDPEA